MLKGLNKREWGVIFNFLGSLTEEIIEEILDDACDIDMSLETNEVVDKFLKLANEQGLEKGLEPE